MQVVDSLEDCHFAIFSSCTEVFWAAVGHVLELGLGTKLTSIFEGCETERRGG